MLNSEFDAHKRIYMVTPKLSGTKAVQDEMIIPVRLRLRGVELKLVMAGGEVDRPRQRGWLTQPVPLQQSHLGLQRGEEGPVCRTGPIHSFSCDLVFYHYISINTS